MLQKFETSREYKIALEKMKSKMVEAYAQYSDNKSPDILEKSFRAKIGSKAEEFANIKERKYYCASEYRDTWFWGLIHSNNEEIKELMLEEVLREYTVLLLEYSFLNHKSEYTRNKLAELDREIYLGKNDMCFGIFISPNFSNESMSWESYKSKGNKAKYEYLTLNQLLFEGYLVGKIIDNKFDAKLVKVCDLSDIINLYEMFISQSSSIYEKKFIDLYLQYIEEQGDWKNIPILLPEVRWGREKTHHAYRTDYLIINYNTGNRLAIEISPYSTHMDKNREEAKLQWIKENNKRNEYFFRYKVPTITFTDDNIGNMNECFEMIKGVFEVTDNTKMPSYEEMVKSLRKSTV